MIPPQAKPIQGDGKQRRRRRWIAGVIGSLVVVVLLGGIGLRVVLPAVIRREVSTTLRRAGFERATFELRQWSPWRTNLASISSGHDQRLRIGEVGIAYSPFQILRSGQVRWVKIRDARLTLELDDFPRIPQIVPASDSASKRSTAPDIELQSCALILRRGNQDIELNFDGTLLRTPSGPSQLNLRAKLGSAPLNLGGTIDLSAEKIDLSVDSGNLKLASLVGLLSADFRAPLREAGGGISFGGEFHREQGQSWSRGGIWMREVYLIGQGDYAGEIQGLDLSVMFQSLQPAMTPPGQTLRARKLSLAGQEFSNLGMEFEIRQNHEIQVAAAHVTWARGSFSAGPFTIRLPSPAIELQLSAAHVDLSQAMAVISGGRATGTGQLSGRVPVRIDWPRLSFGEGFIESESPGELRLGGSIAVMDQMLDQTDPRFSREPQMAQLKQQILAAMTDFQYDRLRLDLTRPASENGKLLVTIHIQGRGRAGPRQPLDITLNYRGLEEGLNSYLAARSRVLKLSQ